MCTTCGCSDTRDVGYTMPGRACADRACRTATSTRIRTITTMRTTTTTIMATHARMPSPHATCTPAHGDRSNRTSSPRTSLLAERNRGWFAGREVLALNLMSSPGAGKTSLLERTIRDAATTMLRSA